MDYPIITSERFEIRRRLGVGGMGVVYEAFDRELLELVALKTLWRTDGQSLYRLKKEFRSLAHLRHPNLVRLGELHEDHGQWFFTMEKIEGVDFVANARGFWGRALCATGSYDTLVLQADDDTPPPRAAVTSPPPGTTSGAMAEGVDEERLRDSLAQLVSGLSALHTAGTIHRDLKPSNILVTGDGRAVLLDFGLAAGYAGTELRSITGEHLVGTATYMAPEQALAGKVGPASDWYSLGVILFEALTGELPFDGSTVQLLLAKQHHDGPSPSSRRAGIPEDLDRLCTELLRRRPEARPTGDAILERVGGERRRHGDVHLSPPPASTSVHGAPFVGRGAELHSLSDAVVDLLAGSSRALLVEGSAGIGKSALLHHFLSRLPRASAEMWVATARCYERESVPIKAIDGIIDSLSRYLRRLDHRRCQRVLPDDVALLCQTFPVLLRVPAISAHRAGDAFIDDPSLRKMRLFAAIRQLLDAVAEQVALILFIDDLHWADAESVEILSEILTDCGAPKLVLATRRADGPREQALDPAFERLLSRFERLPLGGLSAMHSRELVASLSPEGRVRPEQLDFLDRVAAEAAGHPLLLAEIALGLPDRGGEPLALEGLDAVLFRRIRELDARSRRVLELCAIAGFPLEQEALVELSGLSTPECIRSIHLLEVERLLRSHPAGARPSVEPYHGRIAGAVMAHSSEDERRRGHAAVAALLRRRSGELLRPVELVHHLHRAGDDEAAAVEAERAAERLAPSVAFAQRAELYRLALRLGKHEPSRARAIRLELAHAERLAGEWGSALRSYLSVAEDGDGRQRGEALRNAAETLLTTNVPDRAISTCDRLLEDAGVCMERSAVDAFVEPARRAIARASATRVRDARASTLGDDERARLEALDTAMRVAAAIDPTYAAQAAHGLLSSARRWGRRDHAARALAYLAYFEIDGRLAPTSRFLERAARAVRAWTGIDHDPLDPWLRVCQAAALLSRGRAEAALKKLDEVRRALLVEGGSLPLCEAYLLRVIEIEGARSTGAMGRLWRSSRDSTKGARRASDCASERLWRQWAMVALLARDRLDLVDPVVLEPHAGDGSRETPLFAHNRLRAAAELALHRREPDAARDVLVRLEAMAGGAAGGRVESSRLLADREWLVGRLAHMLRSWDRVERSAERMVRLPNDSARVRGRGLLGAHALKRGETDAFYGYTSEALAAAEAAAMPMDAAVYRCMLASVRRDNPQVEGALAQMKALGVVDPERFIEVYLPATIFLP